MTDYEVRYDFQNIRFTDPVDFGGKDTLFTINDLDLSEDEKYELIDFMANHRNSGKADDYFYDYEYWGDNAIFCTTTAYDDDELKAMTEGRLVTSMGPTCQDHFILWNELPGFLKDKIKDYWGSKADMLYEWACSVETMTDDDDFDYDIDDDFDIENKTASNETLSAYVGQPLTNEVIDKIYDELSDTTLDILGFEYSDESYEEDGLVVYPHIGIYFKFYKDGVSVDEHKDTTMWIDEGSNYPIPDSCKGQIITDCQFDPDYDDWDGNIEPIEVEYENDVEVRGGSVSRYFEFTVNIYVS